MNKPFVKLMTDWITYNQTDSNATVLEVRKFNLDKVNQLKNGLRIVRVK